MAATIACTRGRRRFQESWTAGHCGGTPALYALSNPVWTAVHVAPVNASRTMHGMREPLITATLFSIFVGTRGTAKAIGAIQRLYLDQADAVGDRRGLGA